MSMLTKEQRDQFRLALADVSKPRSKPVLLWGADHYKQRLPQWMGLARSGEGNSSKMARHHPSQKPVELMRWCLDHARIGIGKAVLDPYMGTGTTGVAALTTGRRFVGVEIDREDFDVACERISAIVTGMDGRA